MDNKQLPKFLNQTLQYDVNYSEIFCENSLIKNYKFINQKIENVDTRILNGIGITMANLEKKLYTCTNKIDEVIKLIDVLGNNFKSKKRALLKFNTVENANIIDSYNSRSNDEKKELLRKIDNIIRKYDNRISQVEIILSEKAQHVDIINSKGIICHDNRMNIRIVITVIAKESDHVASLYKTFGSNIGYEYFDDIDWEQKLSELCQEVIEQLSAKSFNGGIMPVVIGPGFGSVIFHEACGHAMEAEGIITKTSVLTDKLGEKIASSKVSIVDDGTYNNLFGTTLFDDQGNKTKNNLLIDKGILKSYLVDEINGLKLGMVSTGSGRRENYKYSAVSRMNNTYLLPGTDKVEEMIKTIEHGLYAKDMGGGSVNPTTGEFNFTVNHGYVIRNGKICEPVKNICLIGNSIDILMNVEMVSDNLEFETGYCGASSGTIPVTVGEPTIKVSKILVGGE